MNPLSSIFGSIVALRNELYDRQIFNVHRLTRPVVSIGNISVGGSGKTPFTIALGKLLKQRGITFDVISRGYKRNSSEIAAVDPGGTPEQFGDEPLLMARKLQVPVIVGADRYQAGLFAEKQFPDTKLHLLDDGFQHRRLHRDFDIVMLPAADLQDTLLPVGRLREPLSALERADALVLAPEVKSPHPAKTVWRVRRKLNAETKLPQRLVAFCGIARPQQFFDSLRQAGAELVETAVFPDHHRYSQRDIDRLLQLQEKTRAEGFATTEKDAINLGNLRLPETKIVALELELENPDDAVNTLLSTLEGRCQCRF
ncbi:MAG: tetraacyldisaccharide 4'-kinase [Candidatus Angelobacter sp. Gp1-AA117]|nr:MAG: tetraacyldisaccharide 4'-kinase [Candidatus Angelobacter sp. Gp1-AA117]